MLSRLFYLRFCVILFSLWGGDVWACEKDDLDCTVVGEWNFAVSVGAGLRTNPLFDGDDIPLVVLPSVNFYGKRFFLENYTAGWTLFDDNARNMVNAVVTIGFDQVFFERWDIGNFGFEGGSSIVSSNPALGFSSEGAGPNERVSSSDGDAFNSGASASIPEFVTPSRESEESDGDEEAAGTEDNMANTGGVENSEQRVTSEFHLRKRRLAGLLGLEYERVLGNWVVSVQALSDFTAVHKGSEFRLAASVPLQWQNHSFGIAFGGAWQSQSLVNYYYGVRQNEVTDETLIYSADGGVTTFIRLDWRRPMSEHWSLMATLHNKWLSSEIVDSPLIDESTVMTGFLGIAYRF